MDIIRKLFALPWFLFGLMGVVQSYYADDELNVKIFILLLGVFFIVGGYIIWP